MPTSSPNTTTQAPDASGRYLYRASALTLVAIALGHVALYAAFVAAGAGFWLSALLALIVGFLMIIFFAPVFVLVGYVVSALVSLFSWALKRFAAPAP